MGGASVSSVQLFHGPGAREAAVARANQIGRLVAPPFGDDGLAVGKDKLTDPPGAREIVDMMMSDPIGEGVGVIVVGPIDNAKSIKAMDAMLKTIEEPPSPWMQIILWADDLGGVRETIRSRCLETWSPGSMLSDVDMRALAKRLLDEARAGNFYLLPSLVSGSMKSKASKDDGSTESEDVDKPKKEKFRGVDLVWAMADVLASDLDNSGNLEMWDHIRKVARWRRPSVIEVIAALVSNG